MKNKTFTLIVVAICAFIMATCCFGGYLYSESNRLTAQLNDSTDTEKTHQDDISKMLVADSIELQRIADERKSLLAAELKASVEREKATEEKNNAELNSSRYDNNISSNSTGSSQSFSWEWLQGQWRWTSQYGTVNVYIRGSNLKVYFDAECVYNGSYEITDGKDLRNSYGHTYAGWKIISYPGSYILINLQNKTLCSEEGAPFVKVK